jgi:predicted nucleic acid-binding protein
MAFVAVSDSSALIALHQVGLLQRLAPLFDELVVPPAVAREIAPTVVRLPLWITELPVNLLVEPGGGMTSLGAGEIEAISLAVELGNHYVILDDRPARAFAGNYGLTVIGTVDLLLAAKRTALIPAVLPSMTALVNAGFYISPRLYQFVLTEAGEI